jgi:hypothetical protein
MLLTLRSIVDPVPLAALAAREYGRRPSGRNAARGDVLARVSDAADRSLIARGTAASHLT